MKESNKILSDKILRHNRLRKSGQPLITVLSQAQPRIRALMQSWIDLEGLRVYESR